MTEECDFLDAYLSDELIAEERARFEAHAALCAECREALAEQCWIDRLLRSPLGAELESPAPSLHEVVPVSTQTLKAPTGTRRRRLGVSVLATAAVVLIAMGWIVVREMSVVAEKRHTVEAITSVAEANLAETVPVEAQQSATTDETPRASFVGTGDTIAVPVESEAPDVTIVRLYSVYRPPVSDTFFAEHQAAMDEFYPHMNN